MKWKSCNRCGDYLPATDFHKSRAALDGLQSACKACQKEYQHERSAAAVAQGLCAKCWRGQVRYRSVICAACYEKRKAWGKTHREGRLHYNRQWKAAHPEYVERDRLRHRRGSKHKASTEMTHA